MLNWPNTFQLLSCQRVAFEFKLELVDRISCLFEFRLPEVFKERVIDGLNGRNALARLEGQHLLQ